MSDPVQPTASNRIEKRIELAAPLARVWRAVSDYQVFGEWFRVRLEAPFEAGKEARGMVLHPGYEHVLWRATVQRIEPPHYFSFTWHPYAVEEGFDYAAETPTLVEFRLAETATGTLLTITESGFDRIPAHRRSEAFRMNEGGWSQQIENVKQYVSSHP